MPIHTALAAAALAITLSVPAHAQDLDPDAVAATVNGEPITVGDIASIVADLPDQYRQLPDQTLYDGVLQQLVDQKLMAQAAEAAAIPDNAVVARALEIQRQGLLSDFYMRNQMQARLDEERLNAAFEARYGDVGPTREVRARHILVETEDEAVAIRAELDEGADFAALAAERSTGPSGPRGGELGWFDQTVMVKPFADAAFALSVGDVSEPVKTDFGWHVIEILEERERPAPTLADVRGELASQLGREVAQEVIAELRDAAEIVTGEDRPGLDAFRAPALTEYP